MTEETGLTAGARVAVLGGGVAGAAAALALVQNARIRGRALEVRVYQGDREDSSIAPAVLTPECRSRLAGLGVRVPAELRGFDLRGIEIISGRHRELLAAPSAGLWVLDGWPGRASGQRLLSELLTRVAQTHGVQFLDRRVDCVERQAEPPVPRIGRGGPLVVRAQGRAERFEAAILAFGTSLGPSSPTFRGFEGAPTLPAVHARLSYPGHRLFGFRTARLLLSPLPGIDALLFVPCPKSVYALGFGEDILPADLCQAVMAAARDGHLPGGFEIGALSTTRVPVGPGRKLVAEGQVAVGPLAGGHPFQLGISDTLASCSRGALALIESGGRARALERRYVRDGMSDLLEDALHGARTLRWLRHAGSRAAQAFPRARELVATAHPLSGGVLGLSSPTPLALLRSARRAAFKELFRALVRSTIDPLPASALRPEPDLYYVVDDDPSTREALSSLLEEHGANVVSFGDELSLYSAVARRPPTAILLDVVLNWVDGLTLCEELKRHPLTRQTKVFVLSGLDRPHVKQRAIEAGAEAFVAKPVSPGVLLEVLAQHGAAPPRPEPVKAPAAADGGSQADHAVL